MEETPTYLEGIDLPEEGKQPSWLEPLLIRLAEQDGELIQLRAEAEHLKKDLRAARGEKEPLPALDVPDEPDHRSKKSDGPKKTYVELDIDEEALAAQAQKEGGISEEQKEPGQEQWVQDEAQLFEDMAEEDEEEEVREVDPKYSVTVDRDLIDLMPLFLRARSQEADDMSLWLKMGEFDKIRDTCLKARGATLTLGFEFLAKLEWALMELAKKEDRKKAEKMLFEVSFFLDQCRIVYV